MSKLKCIEKLQKIIDSIRSKTGLSEEEQFVILRRDAVDIVQSTLDELKSIGVDTEKLERCYIRFKNNDMSVATMVGMFILFRIDMKRVQRMDGVCIVNTTIKKLTEVSCAEASLNEKFQERTRSSYTYLAK